MRELLQGEGPVKARIMDIGDHQRGPQSPYCEVAPLGDPVEVTVRGYELSLRKGDADMILWWVTGSSPVPGEPWEQNMI